jgi:hypothetical protein
MGGAWLEAPLESPLLAPAFFDRRCIHASDSRLSSRVPKAAQVLFANLQKSVPRWVVEQLNMLTVESVCMRSFARACQFAQMKSNRKILPLCGSERRPSKAGMIHWHVNTS